MSARPILEGLRCEAGGLDFLRQDNVGPCGFKEDLERADGRHVDSDDFERDVFSRVWWGRGQVLGPSQGGCLEGCGAVSKAISMVASRLLRVGAGASAGA